MATRRTTFEKLQRERDKKAKAAAKRERRQERSADRGEDDGEGEGLEGLGATLTDSDEVRPTMSPAEILEQIEVAHEQYKAGRMTSEDFEERKTELLTILAELPIE